MLWQELLTRFYSRPGVAKFEQNAKWLTFQALSTRSQQLIDELEAAFVTRVPVVRFQSVLVTLLPFPTPRTEFRSARRGASAANGD